MFIHSFVATSTGRRRYETMLILLLDFLFRLLLVAAGKENPAIINNLLDLFLVYKKPLKKYYKIKI